jgi:hypothetical protein
MVRFSIMSDKPKKRFRYMSWREAAQEIADASGDFNARNSPLEMREKVKLWRQEGASEEEIRWLIDEWLGEDGYTNLDDPDWTWAQFVHSEIARGQSMKDVKSALDHYYGACVSARGVVKLCRMDIPEAKKALDKIHKGMRTMDAEWVH